MQTLLQAPQVASNSHSSTKIKPIILPYYRQKTLDDFNAIKASKPHVRNLRNLRFYQPDTRYAPWNRSLKSFVNAIKSQNSLSRLHYQLFSQFEFNTALFSKEFRGLSSLSSLKLEVRESPASTAYVQAFMKTLASFKNLTHLDMHFSVYKVKRSPALEDFFESLAQLRKLTSLSLNIYLGQHARGGELDLLASSLCRLTRLRSLTLRLDKSIETDDKNLITILPSVLAKLPNLAHLELQALGVTIQAPPLLKLFKFFGTMKNLSSLIPNIAWGSVVTESPAETLSDCLACLDPSVIRKLNLTVSPQSLDTLPQALSRFTSLSAIRLYFYNCKVITDENIREISSMLSSLASLEALHLSFPPLAAATLFDSIVSAIDSLQNLKSLSLAFSQLTKVSGKQVQQLFSSLKPSLQFINIFLLEPKSVEDESKVYEKLGENLKNLVLLKSLSLNLGRNNIIKNEEIGSIIDAIKGLQSLSSLELNIGGLENIDETAIQKIAEALRVLPSLTSVNFQLNQCKKLREKEDSLLSLFSALKEKANIVDIRLSISYCEANNKQTTELWRVKEINLAWC